MISDGHNLKPGPQRQVPQASLPARAEPRPNGEPRKRRQVLLACIFMSVIGTTSWGLNGQAGPEPGETKAQPTRAEKEGQRPGRFGGARRGRGPGAGYWNRMPDAEKEEMWSFIEEYFPKMYIELQRARKRSPQRFNRRILWVVHDIREMMDLMETQPERALLMIQERKARFAMRRAAHQYHQASNAKGRDKARIRLRAQCAIAFDCRHRRREMEIRDLEIRIAELKQRHTEAAKMREKLIDQEVEEILERRPGNGHRGEKQGPGGPPSDRRVP